MAFGRDLQALRMALGRLYFVMLLLMLILSITTGVARELQVNNHRVLRAQRGPESLSVDPNVVSKRMAPTGPNPLHNR
uniref:CLAVATA3/endosperm surrounding region 4 n=1 Tax=Selaginella moellendorffii TaxID=88036 RepID=C0STN2_SELML|nr:CLAVATA3/endosperm surrounding region 4 [Selaginella moellendorffii]